MSQEWMIDVLSDLRSFAHKNGLMGLAEQLEDTILVAANDLKLKKAGEDVAANNTRQIRIVHRTDAAGNNV